MRHHAGQIGRRAGVQRNDLDHLAGRSAHALAQFEDEVAAAQVARVPLEVVVHGRAQARRNARGTASECVRSVAKGLRGGAADEAGGDRKGQARA